MSRLLSRLVVVALLVLAGPARADDTASDLDPRTQQLTASLAAEARPHFIAANRAFNAKNYATASSEFEAAYMLDPEVPLLYTWAQSERLGGHCPHAVELYQKYLYSDINEAQADFARRWIKECGGVTVAAPPPPVGPEPAPKYTWYRDKPADALAAAGVIGLVIGTIYFVEAKHSASAAETAFYLDDHDRLRAAATHERNVGIGATVIGALFAGASVGLYVYHARKTDSIAVTSDGHSVAFALQF